MQNARLNEAQARIKIAGGNINNLRYADDTPLMAKSEEELKSLSIRVKEKTEKAALKLNTQKTKIMASSPIILWQIDGEKIEMGQIFFSWVLKSLQPRCSAATKKTLVPWEKSYDKPKQHLKPKKQRYNFANKGTDSQSYGFSSSHVWM